MGDVPLLRMQGVTKRFGALVADDDVTFTIQAGHVRALLGENGAGKSTLMNVLYGLHQPDAGTILIEGREVEIDDPSRAVALGIGMVHQEFMLVPTLSAVENVALGHRPDRWRDSPTAKLRDQLVDLGRRHGLYVDPDQPVWQMSVSSQQRLEILKALIRGARILVLDEPTAVLAPTEVDGLFKVMRQLCAEGIGIVFISHKLSEVMQIANEITVMRQGRVTGEVDDTAQTSARDLAQMMVGRDPTFERRTTPRPGGEPVLEAEGVWALGDRGVPALRGLSLTVRSGEIVGLAGIDGNGQTELLECIAGVRPVTQGEIRIDGRARKKPMSRVEDLGFIPENRQTQGLVGDFDISENLVLRRYRKEPYSRLSWINWKAIRANASAQIDSYSIHASGPRQRARQLSGGNQQKVIIARETQYSPRVLVAGHPTRGLDVGAVEGVLRSLLRQRDKGAGILLVSAELNELLSVSDRVAVIHHGQILGEVAPGPGALQKIGHLMLGETGDAEAGKIA